MRRLEPKAIQLWALALAWFMAGTVFGVLLGHGIDASAAGCDRHVSAPANLQQALQSAGQGKTVCLSGTFSGHDIRPLAGQTLIGGRLHGSSGDGFDLHAGNVTLRDVEVYSYPGRAVVCGPGTRVYGSYLHDNSRNGIGCIANGGDWHIVIDGNTLANNGSARWAGVGASSVKLMELSKPGHALGAGATITHNVVHGDTGNGIWLDRSSSAAIVQGNTIYDESRKAIRCEKCAGPVLFADNTTRDTGDECISVANSAYVTLKGNTTARCGNPAGIWVKNVTNVSKKHYPALSPVDVGYHPYRIVVADTRLAGGGVVGCSVQHVRCSR